MDKQNNPPTMGSKQERHFIEMVAGRLAEDTLELLYQLSAEKNYYIHVGGLAEILDWANQFYDHYYNKVINWEIFRYSDDNIYNAATLDDFILAFGQDRISKFCT